MPSKEVLEAFNLVAKREAIRDIFKRIPLHSASGYRHEHAVFQDREINWIVKELSEHGCVIQVERETHGLDDLLANRAFVEPLIDNK